MWWGVRMEGQQYKLIARFDELRFEIGTVVQEMINLGIIQPDARALLIWGRARGSMMRLSESLRQAYMFPAKKRKTPKAR